MRRFHPSKAQTALVLAALLLGSPRTGPVGFGAHVELARHARGPAAAEPAVLADVAANSPTRPRKVVILYSDTGGGHKTAAQALASRIRQKDPSAQVELKNIWDFAYSPRMVPIKNRLWTLTLRNFPALRDRGYERAMRKGREALSLDDVRQYHLPFDKNAAYQYLATENPDSVIAANYSGLEILRALRQDNHLSNSNLGWILTDYAEGYWPRSSLAMDKVFLSHPALRPAWEKAGVAPEKISVPGMPTGDALSAPVDRAAVLAREGLSDDATTVVIAGGSDGAAPYDRIVAELDRRIRAEPDAGRRKIQIVALTGRNEVALRKLEAMQGSLAPGVSVRALGFIPPERLLDLAKISDVYVAKAGGLSTTEGFRLGKPLVIYSAPGGGVETENVKFIAAENLAEVAFKPEDAGPLAWRLLSDPARRAEILAAQTAYREALRPDEIAEFALQPRPAERRAELARKERLALPGGAIEGNRGLVLDDPREAMHARISVIRNARARIDYNTYIFRADDAGMIQLWQLREAARRGVKVRVVLDDQGGRKVTPAMLAHLRNEGVQIRIYNKRKLDLDQFHRRMHDKFVSSDGERMLAGGRNAQNAYYGVKQSENRINFDDVEVYLEGRDAAQSDDYFDRLFAGDAVAEPAGLDRVSAADIRKAELEINKYNDEHLWNTFGPAPTLADRLTPVDRFRVVHDTFGLGDLSGGMTQDLFKMFRSAKKEIVIVTPYFILTEDFKREFAAARARGIQVRIITNSIRSNDNAFVAAAYKRDLDEIEHLGLEIWEYNGPNMMHSKVMYVDEGAQAYLGSYNIDPRSQRLNTEMGAIIEGSEFSRRQVLPFVERTFRNGTLISRGGVRLGPKATLCGRLMKSLVAPRFVHDFF